MKQGRKSVLSLWLIMAPLAVLAAFVIYPRMTLWLAQDTCLDQGGGWHHEAGYCIRDQAEWQRYLAGKAAAGLQP